MYMVRGHETLRGTVCVILAGHDVVCQEEANQFRQTPILIWLHVPMLRAAILMVKTKSPFSAHEGGQCIRNKSHTSHNERNSVLLTLRPEENHCGTGRTTEAQSSNTQSCAIFGIHLS